MSKKNQSITAMNKPVDDLFDIKNVSSASDCTGLIQDPPHNDDELENYFSLYPYSPIPLHEASSPASSEE